MVRSSQRKRRGRIYLGPENVSLSKAKTYLGRSVENAATGETVYIVKGHKRFILQPVAEIDPIPLRPPGYFADVYSKAEISEENKFAQASVIRAPKNLEVDAHNPLTDRS
jgi:hypothetical protein